MPLCGSPRPTASPTNCGIPHVSVQHPPVVKSAPPAGQPAAAPCLDGPGWEAVGGPRSWDQEAAVAEAIVLERRRLARELHDRPVQSLWFLGIEIRRLHALAAEAPSALGAELRQLQATWAHVYDELRQAMGELHRPLP